LDGQSEAANKIIMMYLRCLTDNRPCQWLRLLPWAEFCCNSSFQASLKTSTFRVVYGHDPLSIRSYEPGDSRLPAVEQQMLERDEFLVEIRDRLEQAQQFAKQQYDKTHRLVVFKVGDWVWLRLHQCLAAAITNKWRASSRWRNVSSRSPIVWCCRLGCVFTTSSTWCS